jgi:uncharacterized membrane protein
MASLLAAAIFFIAIHLGIAGTRLRDRITDAIGAPIYLLGFSAASLAGVVWLVAGYRGAPYIPTWGVLDWWKPVAILLMVPAALLVAMGLATPNPTSVAQEARVAQPPHGIVRVTRHPFLVGVALWALVHLVANGDMASLVFFATWAIVSLAGTVSIDAKRRRKLGAAWDSFAAQTSIIPFAADRNGGAIIAEIGLSRWIAGIAVYALLLGLHGRVIGVSPFPM